MVPSQLQSCLALCLVLQGQERSENVGLRTLVLRAPEMHTVGSHYQSAELGVTWDTNDFLLEAEGSPQCHHPWKVGFECLE